MREEIITSGRLNPYIDPHLDIWHWHIPLYLFLGGLAAGILFFASLYTILGKENRLHSILATRLAVSNQIQMSVEELEQLYPKLKLGSHLAEDDFNKNQYILNKIQTLGEKLLGN